MAQSKRSPANRHRNNTPPAVGKWIVLLLLVVAGLLAFIAAHLWKKDDQSGRSSTQHDARSVTKPSSQAPIKPEFEFYTLLPKQSNSPVMTPPGDHKSAEPAASAGRSSRDEKAASESKDASKDVNYWIQAGSFATQAEADRRKAEIALQGFSSEVRTALVKGKNYYRIQIGPIKSSQLSAVKRRLDAAHIDTLPARTAP